MMDRVILPYCSRLAGREITQFTAILDLSGISLTDLVSSKVLSLLGIASKMVDNYFPEIVYKTFVINAPMMFSGSFKVIKPLLGHRTQNQLSIKGSNFQDDLHQTVPRASLPLEYGGTNPQPFDNRDYGPYAQEIQLCLYARKWQPTAEERFGFAANFGLQGQQQPGMPMPPGFAPQYGAPGFPQQPF